MTRSPMRHWSRRGVLTTVAGAGSALELAGCLGRPPDEHSSPDANPTPNDTQSSQTTGEITNSQTMWPQFGFDAQNTGFAPSGTGPRSNPTVRWRFDARTPTMNTSPVVVDGTVFVAGSGDPGSIYAVNAATGEAEWQFEPAGYATSAPAIVDDVLYVGTWGRRFYAIDTATGDERWSTEVGHRIGSSSPVVVDGTIYVGTMGDGPLVVSGPEDEEQFEACALLALDAATGDELWRYDEFGEKDNISSSPAAADGRVFFGGDDAVYAVDTESGNVAWQRDIPTHSDSSPAVKDGVVYYGAPALNVDEYLALVWALDAETGDTIWKTGVDDVSLRTSPAVADGTVYVAASSRRVCWGGGDDDSNCSGVTRGRLYAIDAASGDRQWHAEIETDTRSSPAVADGMIYVGCRNGVSAVTAAGESAWRIDFESDRDNDPYVDSSPAIAGGAVFIGASDGHLRAIAESG